MASLIGVRGLAETTERFRRRLIESAAEIGTAPDFLATVISFESAGTFSASIRNPHSNCVGLIQFCKPAASNVAKVAGLAMSGSKAQEWLAQMSAEAQLKQVVSYFLAVSKGRRALTLEETYLLVLAPAFALRPGTAEVYSAGSIEYDQNSQLDKNGDGAITVSEITQKIRDVYIAAMQNPRIEVAAKPAARLGFVKLAFAAASLLFTLSRLNPRA